MENQHFNNKDIKTIIGNTSWRKTKYISEHEYLMIKDNQKLYKLLYRKISSEGYTELFLTKKYKYFNIDNYKYWICYPCINRARLKNN